MSLKKTAYLGTGLFHKSRILEEICLNTDRNILDNSYYTANGTTKQGLCRGFLQYLQGKSCNIYRFSLQFLQSVNIAGKICKYYRIFLADIAENPCRVPVNPCKHLQCSLLKVSNSVLAEREIQKMSY